MYTKQTYFENRSLMDIRFDVGPEQTHYSRLGLV